MSTGDDVSAVIQEMKIPVLAQELVQITSACPTPVPIKPLTQAIEMARTDANGDSKGITALRFEECCHELRLFSIARAAASLAPSF